MERRARERIKTKKERKKKKEGGKKRATRTLPSYPRRKSKARASSARVQVAASAAERLLSSTDPRPSAPPVPCSRWKA